MIFLRDDSPDVTPQERAGGAMAALAHEMSVTIEANAGPAVQKLQELLVMTGRGMGKMQLSQRFMAEFKDKVKGQHIVVGTRDEASRSRLYNHDHGHASDTPPIVVTPCKPKWDLDYMADILDDLAEEEKKDQAKAKGQGFCPKGHKMKGGFCRRCSR